jgi:hypothetical protein
MTCHIAFANFECGPCLRLKDEIRLLYPSVDFSHAIGSVASVHWRTGPDGKFATTPPQTVPYPITGYPTILKEGEDGKLTPITKEQLLHTLTAAKRAQDERDTQAAIYQKFKAFQLRVSATSPR